MKVSSFQITSQALCLISNQFKISLWRRRESGLGTLLTSSWTEKRFLLVMTGVPNGCMWCVSWQTWFMTRTIFWVTFDVSVLWSKLLSQRPHTVLPSTFPLQFSKVTSSRNLFALHLQDSRHPFIRHYKKPAGWRVSRFNFIIKTASVTSFSNRELEGK